MTTSSDHPGGWIGVDLDGTLAHYDRWRGAEHIGVGIPAMLHRVRSWLEQGFEVRIFTARVCIPDELVRDGIIRRIQDWLEAHDLPRLPVTCVKDYAMIQLWDDRAVQVIPNTGEAVLRWLDS